jgi:hypothetical protein
MSAAHRHRIVTDADIARRAELHPPRDGGRAEARRDRMSALSRPEHTGAHRVPCVARCGMYVWTAGDVCHRCETAMRAEITREENPERPWWRPRRAA